MPCAEGLAAFFKRRILTFRRITMRKNAWSCAIGVIACTATVGLVAQAATSQRSASENTRHFVVIGCVSRETQGATTANPGAAIGARFIITDTRGGRASVYRLDGEQNQLELHVGHTLEIAGPISSDRPSAGRGPNAGAPVLKVESLTYISKSCQKS
jgi:hypothetical protein